MHWTLWLAYISVLSMSGWGCVKFWQLKTTVVKPEIASDLSDMVFVGLTAFRKRALSSIFQILLYLVAILWIFSVVFHTRFSGFQGVAFVLGGLAMGFATQIGLGIAPGLVLPIISHCEGHSHRAFRALLDASVSISFMIVGCVMTGLLVCLTFLPTQSVIGYSVGVLLAAFFLRIGGGLYRSSAYLGAAFAAALHPEIPQFDRRNPGALLEITGDYISRLMGFASDLLSSYVFAISTAIFMAFFSEKAGLVSASRAAELMHLPLMMVSVGCLAMMAAVLFGQLRLFYRSTNLLLEMVYVSIGVCLGVSVFLAFMGHFGVLYGLVPFWMGLAGAVLIAFSSEYLTSKVYPPVQRLAQSAQLGGVFILYKSMATSLITAVLFSLYILSIVGLSFFVSQAYGLALAALGMLCVTGSILVGNIFSPFASHILKVMHLSEIGGASTQHGEKLNKMGQTTLSLGSGFAAGVTAVSILGLFAALILLVLPSFGQEPLFFLKAFLGLVAGPALLFTFWGLLLMSLGKLSEETRNEIVRQFQQIPYLRQGQVRPDIAFASDFLARGSMNSLILPGMIMVVCPLVLGHLFGIPVLVGFCLGTTVLGILFGFHWVQWGEALHQAKNYIREGNLGGVDTPTYQTIVEADLFSEGFRNVLGGSTNIFVKSVSLIATLVAMGMFM